MELRLRALRRGAWLCFALAVAPAPGWGGAAPSGEHPWTANSRDRSQPPSESGPIYIKQRPVIAPVFLDGGVAHIGVEVSLEVAGKSAQERVFEYQPRLSDAFMRELNAIVTGPWIRDNGVDHEAVKRRFLAVCERVLGPHVVRNIFVQRSYRRRVS